MLAASTVGSFLRATTLGTVSSVQATFGETLTRAWAAGLGPQPGGVLVVDVDSTEVAVFGRAKQGAGRGHGGVLCQHPLLAVEASTGQIVGLQLREGSANTQRGVERFLRLLVWRL